MRAIMYRAVAAAAAGFGLSQPAAAGGWDYECCGGTVYVHHHVYYPPRYVHVYHHHKPRGARHINVVHYPYGCCDYVAPWRVYHWRRYW
jgi:hypothetical protein